MNIHKEQRVGIFTDVQNLYYSAKNLYSTRVNFDELVALCVNDRKLIRSIAYVISADNSEEVKFFDFLKNIGFEVRQKELQQYWGGKTKGDWDVGMTIDTIKLADKLDVVSLVTGDGDFIPLVEYLQFKGVLVEVLAFGRTASTKLTEKADYFIDLDHYSDNVLLDMHREAPL